MKIIIKTISLLLISIIILSGCKKTNEKYAVGKWQENVYYSDWLQIKFSLPEGWYIATADQMSKIIDETSAVFNDEENEIDLSKADIIYEFIISEEPIDTEYNYEYIIFMSQRLSSLQKSIKDEKDYLSYIKEDIINTQGIETIFQITLKKEFAGKTFYYMDASVITPNSVILSQRYYCIIKGDFASLFIVTTSKNDHQKTFESFESRFSQNIVSSPAK